MIMCLWLCLIHTLCISVILLVPNIYNSRWSFDWHLILLFYFYFFVWHSFWGCAWRLLKILQIQRQAWGGNHKESFFLLVNQKFISFFYLSDVDFHLGTGRRKFAGNIFSLFLVILHRVSPPLESSIWPRFFFSRYVLKLIAFEKNISATHLC